MHAQKLHAECLKCDYALACGGLAVTEVVLCCNCREIYVLVSINHVTLGARVSKICDVLKGYDFNCRERLAGSPAVSTYVHAIICDKCAAKSLNRYRALTMSSDAS